MARISLGLSLSVDGVVDHVMDAWFLTVDSVDSSDDEKNRSEHCFLSGVMGVDDRFFVFNYYASTD